MPLRRHQVLADVLNQRPHFRRVPLSVEIVVIIVLNRLLGRPVRHGHTRSGNVTPGPRLRKPPRTDGTVLRLLPGARLRDALVAEDVSALRTKAVAQPAGPEDRHGLLAAGAGDLAGLAQRRDDNLALVQGAAVVPGEGLLERAVVAQETHLQVRLEQPELGALLGPAGALADRARQGLLRVLVLLALGGGEFQRAQARSQPGQLNGVLGAAQAERLEEHHEAVLDDGRVLNVLLKGDLDPLAEDGGFGEGLGANEGEERADVGKFVLDGRAGEAPP